MYSYFYFRSEADALVARNIARHHDVSVDSLFKVAALGGWWVCRVSSVYSLGFRRHCLGLFEYEIKHDCR